VKKASVWSILIICFFSVSVFAQNIDNPSIQGKWRIVEQKGKTDLMAYDTGVKGSYNLLRMPREHYKNGLLTINGDAFKWRIRPQSGVLGGWIDGQSLAWSWEKVENISYLVASGKIAQVTTGTPKGINLTYKAEDKELAIQCIYEIKGDELWIVKESEESRPGNFAVDNNETARTLIILKKSQ
jgi:hypothetical protein